MSDSLYGSKKPTKLKGKEISSSNSLSFSSNLASLISSSGSKSATSKQPRSTKDKDDIFTAHQKKVKKRAAEELESENGQKYKTKDEVGAVSAADLHRSKRRMEEKVRLYNAMKRGEYVHRDDGYDDRGLVDFDQKWAQKQYDPEDSDHSNESSDIDIENGDEIVEYTDEFGRLRKGTKKQAEKEERQARIQAIAKADAEHFAARPQAPTNIIYGDAVQHQAFNPEKTIAEQMAELARKRDKSATPPPANHFDASAEIRTKGTAFYAFSQDEKERQREMAELEKARLETEQLRKARAQSQQAADTKGDLPTKQTEQLQSTKKAISDAGLNEDAQRFLEEFELPPS